MIERSYVDVGWGQLHVARCDPRSELSAAPIVCLHQTPRSWDEFRELLPLLAAASVEAVAVDLPGMGSSDPHPDGHAIEHYAAGVVAALERLEVGRAHVLGHHTGGVVAVEVAAQAPALVASLLLSSTPYIDAGERERRTGRASIDDVDVQPDGSHLVELWQRRAPHYPPDRPDLLQRFVADAIRAPGSHAGHAAVGRYEMEARLPLVTAPVLLIGHAQDPFAFPHLDRLATALGRPHERVVIDDGVIPLEASASEVAEAALAFVASSGRPDRPPPEPFG